MLIVNGLVLTLGPNPQVIPNGALRIEGSKITAISPTEELVRLHPTEQKLDAERKGDEVTEEGPEVKEQNGRQNNGAGRG